MDIVFAVAIVGWLEPGNDRADFTGSCRADRGRTGPALSYNLWFFGTIMGGQKQLEHFQTIFHNVSGPWSGEGPRQWSVGDPFSPNRGLLIFSPWIVVAIATLAWPSLVRRGSPPTPFYVCCSCR